MAIVDLLLVIETEKGYSRILGMTQKSTTIWEVMKENLAPVSNNVYT